MKRFLTVMSLAVLLVPALSLFGCSGLLSKLMGNGKTDSPENTVDYSKPTPETALGLTAGVNVNGLEGTWYFKHAMQNLTQESTYENIKKQGFDHIRIPVDMRSFYSEEEKKLDEKQMKKFDKILDLAEEHGLYAFIDFHGWWDFDPAYPEQRELFITLWELFAERYKDRSDLVVFELINEPSIKTMTAAELNKLQEEAIAAIRKTNPERLIVCAAPDGNQPWLLGELKLPKNDKNLAVAVHIYHPGDFTHQGFDWAGREKGKQVILDDKMLEELNWNLNETKKFMESTGIPVFLNEFGLNLELARDEDIDLYLRTITQFCRDNNVPWAIWGYDNQEMAVYSNKQWRTEVLDSLFLREPEDE